MRVALMISSLGPGGAEAEMKRSHQTSQLDRMLEVR